MNISEQGPATKAAAQSTSGGERDYGRSIRAAARGLLTGVFDEFSFIDSMIGTIQRGLTRAFGEGMKRAGASIEDIDTPAYLPERLALDGLINTNLENLFSFSAYIQQQHVLYLDGQKQAAINHVMNRATLWSNQYDKARQQAYTMAAGDAPQTWRLGSTKEHCQSCLTFNGRTYRASTWAKYNALPKSTRLCCGGLRCLCGLVPAAPGTKITPGRFPEGALCN
jgi:hypothetical protein